MSNVPLRNLNEFATSDDAYPTAFVRRMDDLQERMGKQLEEVKGRKVELQLAISTIPNLVTFKKDLELARFGEEVLEALIAGIEQARLLAFSDAQTRHKKGSDFVTDPQPPMSEKVGGFSDKKQP